MIDNSQENRSKNCDRLSETERRHNEEIEIHGGAGCGGSQAGRIGVPVADICRRLGVTEVTFYRWKKRFAGMGVTELRKLRQLDEESRKLKSLVADLILAKHMLQEVIAKNL